MMSRTRRWCQLRATLLVEEESAHQFHFIGSRGRSVTRVCCSHNYTDQIIIIFNAEKNNADSVVKWSTVQAMSAMSVQRFNCGVHCSCRVSTFCWGTHSLHWKFVDGFCVGITSREWGKATKTANDSGVLCNENPYKSSMKMCMCLSAPLRSYCPAWQILRPRSMHATSHSLPRQSICVGAGEIEILCMNLCIYILVCICRVLKPMNVENEISTKMRPIFCAINFNCNSLLAQLDQWIVR